jgi:putative endonuclease
MKVGYVYIVARPSRTIYTGVTSDPEGRIWDHKHGTLPVFTKRYGCTRLVLIEECGSMDDAIAREKEIKGWTRAKKIALIEATNPRWFDLARDWYV